MRERAPPVSPLSDALVLRSGCTGGLVNGFRSSERNHDTWFTGIFGPDDILLLYVMYYKMPRYQGRYTTVYDTI